MNVQNVLLCSFNCKLKSSEVSLASPGIENIRHVPGNGAEFGQNYAHPDFDQLRLDFPGNGKYFSVPGTLK